MCLASIVMTEAIVAAHRGFRIRAGRNQRLRSRRPIACSAGNPEQMARNYFSDSGGRFFAGVWESTPGRWRVRYTENEFCHLTRGRIRIEDARRATVELHGRRFVRDPRGLRGHVGSDRADRQALRDLRTRCFLVLGAAESRFAPEVGRTLRTISVGATRVRAWSRAAGMLAAFPAAGCT